VVRAIQAYTRDYVTQATPTPQRMVLCLGTDIRNPMEWAFKLDRGMHFLPCKTSTTRKPRRYEIDRDQGDLQSHVRQCEYVAVFRSRHRELGTESYGLADQETKSVPIPEQSNADFQRCKSTVRRVSLDWRSKWELRNRLMARKHSKPALPKEFFAA
jgi:hypothetical protein